MSYGETQQMINRRNNPQAIADRINEMRNIRVDSFMARLDRAASNIYRIPYEPRREHNIRFEGTGEFNQKLTVPKALQFKASRYTAERAK